MRKAVLTGSAILVQEVQLVQGHAKGKEPRLYFPLPLRLLLVLLMVQTQVEDRIRQPCRFRLKDREWICGGRGGQAENNLHKESVITSRFLITISRWLVVPISEIGEEE